MFSIKIVDRCYYNGKLIKNPNGAEQALLNYRRWKNSRTWTITPQRKTKKRFLLVINQYEYLNKWKIGGKPPLILLIRNRKFYLLLI